MKHNTNKGLIISGAIILITLLADIFFVQHHSYYWWHGFVGFDVLFGFLGCVLLIKFAKGLGNLFIQKKEDFYGGGEDQ